MRFLFFCIFLSLFFFFYLFFFSRVEMVARAGFNYRQFRVDRVCSDLWRAAPRACRRSSAAGEPAPCGASLSAVIDAHLLAKQSAHPLRRSLPFHDPFRAETGRAAVSAFYARHFETLARLSSVVVSPLLSRRVVNFHVRGFAPSLRRRNYSAGDGRSACAVTLRLQRARLIAAPICPSYI